MLIAHFLQFCTLGWKKTNIWGPGEEDGEFVDESLAALQQTDDYEEFVDENIDNLEEVIFYLLSRYILCILSPSSRFPHSHSYSRRTKMRPVRKAPLLNHHHSILHKKIVSI